MYENCAVLFVDDEVNILSTLKRGLIEEEYTCYFASSGKEALQILEQKKIGVIVSDMRMPEMDGLKLLREVELLYPKMVKIILSGYTQLPQILTTINQVDIFKFITKPWKMEEEFKVAIHKALDYYILKEENEEIKVALKNKNLAYINILKNIEDIVASAKKSSDILGECGRQILSFNEQVLLSLSKKEFHELLLIQGKIFDLIISAVKVEDKDVTCESLLDEAVQNIESYLPITKIDMKQGFLQKIKINSKIAIAILVSCVIVFEEEFKKSGLYLVAAVNNLNNPTISMICPMDTSGIPLLNAKIKLLNTVITEIAEYNMMNFCLTPLKGNTIALLTMNTDKQEE